jgi:hypothetical protein
VEKTQTSPVTVEECDALIKAVAEGRAKRDALNAELTELNKSLMELEAKGVHYLKELGRKSYASEHGTLSIVEKWRVNLPGSREEKEKLFHWMHEKGIFWEYATVNSNSLNKLHGDEWEKAKEAGEGMDFQLPGIEPPKLSEIVSFRRK